MKTRKLFFIAGLLAALSFASADDNVPVGNLPAGMSQISLQVSDVKYPDEHFNPLRTPSKNPILPSLYFDEENPCIYILCDEIVEMISYEIIAETDGATVLSGQSASVSLLTVPLGELECGEYSIVLTVDDNTYEGAFCIE